VITRIGARKRNYVTKSNDIDPWLGGDNDAEGDKKAEPKATSKAKPAAKATSKAKPAAIAKSKVKPAAKAKSKPKSAAKAKSKAKPAAKAKSKPKSAAKADLEPEVTSEAAVTPEPEVTPAAEVTPDPEATVSDTPVTETVEDQVDESESESKSETDSDAPKAKTKYVPTTVPIRTRTRGESLETYGSNRSGRDGVYTRRSEAKFVPSEPKFYVAPKDPNVPEEPEFGFPEVPENTQRLFIAIEVPRTVKRDLVELSQSFRPREHERVRWIEEEAMHLTLKFLGDTPIDKIPDIKIALKRAAESSGRFSIKIGRTGCFPSFVDPRICWVGFTGELRRLEQLQGRVEGGMVALKLESDNRKFRAHITVGRTRPGVRGRFAEDIGYSWQHAPLRSTGTSVPVNAVALYRSHIDDYGDTQYEQLANYELG
jgi:2'-5' RNA ligase